MELDKPSLNLTRNDGTYMLTRPVFFVGFMGSGKTSLARRLARSYGVASVDADTYLERREGRKIKEIFASDGEEAFRDVETAVLRELATGDPHLISCGGGVIGREENREILKQQGYVVYLEVTADEAAARIRSTSTRPLFQNMEQARLLNEKRKPLYEEVADVHVQARDKSVSALAHEVASLLIEEGVLCQRPR